MSQQVPPAPPATGPAATMAAGPTGGASAHPTAPAARPGRSLRRWGIGLLIPGVLLSLLGLGMLIFAFVNVAGMTRGAANAIHELPGGQGVITLDQGETIQLYGIEGDPTPRCTIVGPPGAEMQEGMMFTSSRGVDGRSWVSFTPILTASASGEYVVECDAEGPVAVAPPISAAGLFGSIGGFFLGGGSLGLGLVLGLAGLVLAIMGWRRGRAM
ncbi:hypothetical protein JSY14_09520 [Brachybacterium sp. EF45031]|uniref:hypothetical protein n=1 Tax=Brachybacterium sillae TaxID=2810536 RepID=UPI00217D5D94|nr:hypothetical protein [Brachybacterium sillae]MCS6712244.1 hypothetical protein [Brachybacterium sillae]